jgi:hypothetical protein
MPRTGIEPFIGICYNITIIIDLHLSMINLLVIIFFVSIIFFIVGLIKPTAFSSLAKGEMTRKKIWIIFGTAIIVSFVLIGVVANSPINNNKIIEQSGLPITAPGTISISIEEWIVTPFDTMIISGKNIDTNSAASVILTDSKNQSITIPATRVTANDITIIVPPMGYNKAKGAFTQEMVSIQVVQANKDGERILTKLSNKIIDVVILPPVVPSILQRADAKNIPKGTITKGFVTMALKTFDPVESESLAKAPIEMKQLLAGLETFVKNSKTKIALKKSKGKTEYLDAAGVAWLDAFYSGMLGMAEKNQMLAVKDNSFSIIPVAQAAKSNCRSNWEAEPHAASALQMEMACFYQNMNFIDREGKTQSEINDETFDLMKKQALLLGGVAVAVAIAPIVATSIPAQIAAGITYSLLTDFMYNNKTPGINSLPDVGVTIIDSIMKMPNLFPATAILSLAVGVSNDRCAKDTRRCISSPFILADFFNARALVLASYDFNKPSFDKLTVAEWEAATKGAKGIDENGKEIGVEPDILPVEIKSKTAPVKPDILPVEIKSNPDPVKSKAACAAGYTTCGQGCILSSSTCCPGGAISCPAGSTCTSDNTCAVGCKAGHEVCGQGCMTAGEICCPGGTISCPAGSTCTSDNRCAPSVKSSGCEVGYEVCGDSCMTAGRICCPGTSLSCPGGNTCTSDNMCLAPENNGYGEPCAGGLYGTNGRCVICSSGDAHLTAIDSSCSPALDGIYCCGGGIGGCLQDFATMDQSNMTPEQLREAASCGFDF